MTLLARRHTIVSFAVLDFRFHIYLSDAAVGTMYFDNRLFFFANLSCPLLLLLPRLESPFPPRRKSKPPQ